MRLLSRSVAFAIAVAGAIFPALSQSQVVPAIKGGGSQINVYGLYSLVNPDGRATLDYPRGTVFPSGYNNAQDWNQGGAVGADFRTGKFFWGQPAIGVRATFSSGNFAGEDTYLFGPEVHYSFRRLRPYGNFYLGPGDIHYKGGFSDNSIVYDIGGGVDYHVNHRFSVRLFDFQYQFWNLGTHTYPAGFVPGVPQETIDTTLKPYTLNFGAVIRLF